MYVYIVLFFYIHGGNLRIACSSKLRWLCNISKTSASVSLGFPNTRKLMKNILIQFTFITESCSGFAKVNIKILQ